MFNNIVLEVAALAGFAALVSLIINILKIVKIKGQPVVTDGSAQKWSAGLNLAGILALYVYRIFYPEAPVTGIDATLMEIATVGSYILMFISQLGISKVTHEIVKGTPVIGRSYSLDRLRILAAKTK